MSDLDIFEYSDFRAFLQDWFNKKKENNPNYSHRLFARRVNSKNPSVLHHVIKNRRPLPPAMVPAFCRAMGLKTEAATYFGLLATYGQLTDVDAAQRALASLIDFHARRTGPTLDGDHLRFMTRWIYPAIYTLAMCRGFRADPATIAKALRPRITEAAASEALAALFRMGLLEQADEGTRVHGLTLRTSPHVARLGSLGYHQDTHQLAGDALERIWSKVDGAEEETAFIGVAVPIPSARMAEVRKLIYNLQLKLISECAALEGPPDTVLQVNLHAFPVSEPPS